MSEKPSPKKRGRKPILDPELVAAALAEVYGNVSAVAKKFGVCRTSVVELIQKRPSLQRVLKDAREGMLDNAETSLHKSVLDGQGWAVCFCLKTAGKHRGYVERQELTGADGGAIRTDNKNTHTLDPQALRAFNDDLARAGLADVPADGGAKPVDPKGGRAAP